MLSRTDYYNVSHEIGDNNEFGNLYYLRFCNNAYFINTGADNVTALNPKGIAFFVAFLPQFISPNEPVFNQLLLLGGTFLFLALVNAALYALFASQLREVIRKTSVRKWFNRCGGAALIGAGIFTAGMQRSA
jgi:hypothetical protein